MKYVFFCLALLPTLLCASGAGVDFIIFSYNRPMQLFALLESSEKYIHGIDRIQVIYRADEAYKSSYDEVWRRFPGVIALRQSSAPHIDFKPLLIEAFSRPVALPYVMFAVDDIIVKDFIDLKRAVEALLHTHAWGFYLRMGKNITYSYTQNIPLQVPKGRNLSPDYFKWRFSEGKSYWGFPNTVDMTIYRKKDIEPFVQTAHYTNPNTFEDAWWRRGTSKKHGLSFQESKVVNIPLNLVYLSPARHLNSYSAKDLLDKFKQGLKIDIGCYEKLQNNSAHFDQIPQFIER